MQVSVISRQSTEHDLIGRSTPRLGVGSGEVDPTASTFKSPIACSLPGSTYWLPSASPGWLCYTYTH
jgi:hypothetical protein